jgi:hypothetical protein
MWSFPSALYCVLALMGMDGSEWFLKLTTKEMVAVPLLDSVVCRDSRNEVSGILKIVLMMGSDSKMGSLF